MADYISNPKTLTAGSLATASDVNLIVNTLFLGLQDITKKIQLGEVWTPRHTYNGNIIIDTQGAYTISLKMNGAASLVIGTDGNITTAGSITTTGSITTVNLGLSGLITSTTSVTNDNNFTTPLTTGYTRLRVTNDAYADCGIVLFGSAYVGTTAGLSLANSSGIICNNATGLIFNLTTDTTYSFVTNNVIRAQLSSNGFKTTGGIDAGGNGTYVKYKVITNNSDGNGAMDLGVANTAVVSITGFATYGGNYSIPCVARWSSGTSYYIDGMVNGTSWAPLVGVQGIKMMVAYV